MAWTQIDRATEDDYVQAVYEVSEPFDVFKTKSSNIEKAFSTWTKGHGYGASQWIDMKKQHLTASKYDDEEDTRLYATFDMKPNGSNTEVSVSISGKKMAKISFLNELIQKIKEASGLTTATVALEKRKLPTGSEDAVTMEEIKPGDILVDFHDEYKNGRYYKKSTFTKLNGKNPFTRKAISEYKNYTAGGKRRRKINRTRKHKKTRKH